MVVLLKIIFWGNIMLEKKEDCMRGKVMVLKMRKRQRDMVQGCDKPYLCSHVAFT